MAINNQTPVKSISQAKKDAGVPIQISREDIASLGVVKWLSAEGTQARNPQTGEMGDGFFCRLADSNGEVYTTFLGNVVLVKDIAKVADVETGELARDGAGFLVPNDTLFPFMARLTKVGNTWRFED